MRISTVLPKIGSWLNKFINNIFYYILELSCLSAFVIYKEPLQLKCWLGYLYSLAGTFLKPDSDGNAFQCSAG